MCLSLRPAYGWLLVAGVLGVLLGTRRVHAHAEVRIDSQSSAHPYPGVEHIAGRVTLTLDGRKANFDAAIVSLCNDYIHVDATEPGLGLMTPSAWGQRAGVQIAVNGDFYKSSYVYGDAAGGGMRWPASATGMNKDSWFSNKHGWIAFGENWVDYTHTKLVKNDDNAYPSLGGWKPNKVSPDLPAGTFAMVSGFPELVVEGEAVTCSSPTLDSCFRDRSDMRTRHPRSAMGLTKDRKKFMLVVVDGRSTSSAGMYGTELADLMKKLGAHVAFNIDGGGSTGMWIQEKGYVNNPSDGSARSVKNHWGIFAGNASGMSKVPGSCVELNEPEVENTPDASVESTFDASVESTPDASVDVLADGGVATGQPDANHAEPGSGFGGSLAQATPVSGGCSLSRQNPQGLSPWFAIFGLGSFAFLRRRRGRSTRCCNKH